MDAFQIILAFVFIVGIGGLIWTIITYPKDVYQGVFVETPRAFFERIIGYFTLLLLPFWLLALLINRNAAERLFAKIAFTEKSKEKLFIDIHTFKREIIVWGIDPLLVEMEMKEAADCSPELDISEYTIRVDDSHVRIVLPNVRLYGFAFLVQWLATRTSAEAIGLARGNNLSFAFQNNEETLWLHGITNDGRVFYINLFEDVDALGALRLDPDLVVADEEHLHQVLKAMQ